VRALKELSLEETSLIDKPVGDEITLISLEVEEPSMVLVPVTTKPF